MSRLLVHLGKWGYKKIFCSLRLRILFCTPYLKILGAAHVGNHLAAKTLFACKDLSDVVECLRETSDPMPSVDLRECRLYFRTTVFFGNISTAFSVIKCKKLMGAKLYVCVAIVF